MEREPQHILTLFKSGAVGLAATLADLLVLTALVERFHVPPSAASLPALVAGVAMQFVGNKWFAFEDTSRRWGRQGALFLAVELGALTLNALLFDRLVALDVLPYLVARVAVQGAVYFGFSLPLWSRIFSPGRTS